MSHSGAINYRDTYFEKKDLTPIHGEPTPDSLLHLKNELKTNARSVPSNLGGGTHGHLGLVLSPDTYALLSNIPFDRPNHPGPLAIPPGTINHMANTIRDQHNEALRVFREVLGVDQALLQQLVEAIEPQYLSALRNRQSNSITLPFYDVLNYLQDTFGRVTPQMLDDRIAEVTCMSYTPTLPIDIVFNAIDDLCDFAELAQIPLTQVQTVNKGYSILLCSGHFREALKEWKRRAPRNQNWTDFKVFFCRAHQEPRETTDLTVEEAQRQQHQANLIEQVVAGVQEVLDQNIPPPPTVQPDPIPAPTQQVANMTIDLNALLPQLIQQMQQMQNTHMEQIQALITQCQPTTQPPNCRRLRTRTYTKYCWTHGACFHDSASCRNKAEGHQDAATLTNCMGGSNCNIPSGTT